jgi:hypothetical protein
VITPEVLNTALQEYVATVPNKENLAAHLAGHEPAEERAAITAEVTGLIGLCEDFLYGYAGGVPWTNGVHRGVPRQDHGGLPMGG